MRFATHLFPELDDKSIVDATKSIFARITSTDQAGILWMALETYTKSPLRENDGKRIELTLRDHPPDGRWFDVKEEGSNEQSSSRTIGDMVAASPAAWLSLTDTALKDLAHSMEVDLKQATTVTVRANTATDVARHPSFGFYKAAV